MDESQTVRDDLRDAFAEIRTLEREIEREELHMAETGEFERYTDLIERFKTIGGYTYENDLERVARGIGIYDLLGRTLAGISG
jgi:ATPase subunit of ABC transporter with duplicated ATPase domains